jgi:hypothetical protein
MLKGLFGVNLYQVSKNFIAPSLIGGVAFIPIALIAAKFISPRLNKFPRFRAFTDMLAGNDLQRTREFLDKLSKFENPTHNE